MGYNVTVDVDKCVGCGECVDVCPVEVYEIKDGKSEAVNAEECLGCESCVEVCEVSAITVEENYGLHGCPCGIHLLTRQSFHCAARRARAWRHFHRHKPFSGYSSPCLPTIAG